MTAKLELRHATREEMPAVLELMDRSFSKQPPGWFRREMPHLYADPEVWRTAHLAFLDGTLVGHVGVYPLLLRLPSGGRLRVGGIGGVACAPEARGQGVMAALLQRTIAAMRTAGHAASILWGDRWRYANYGWEPCGRRLEWTYDARHDRGDHPELPAAPTDPAPLIAAWDRLPGAVLDRAAWDRHLSRPGWRHARVGGASACWSQFGDGSHRRVDLIAGPRRDQHLLLRALAAGCSRVSVVCHGTWDPAWRLARELASEWSERPLAQMAIYDLRAVLEAALPDLAARADGAGRGDLNLVVGSGRARQAVALRNGRGLRIAPPVPGAPTLRDAEVVRALFGSQAAEELPRPFDRILPLHWGLPGIQYV